MKISKITIDNVRCFKHLEINLKTEDGIMDWLVILGDNGVGKTTILRSIALGISEQSGASGLIDELDGDWIRKGHRRASIKIDVEPYPGCKEEAFIITKFKKTVIEEVEVEQKVVPEKPNTFKWNDLFLCGYGAARRQYGARTYSEYTVTDAVYTLFNYNHELQNPELNIRRAQSIGIKQDDIFNRLCRIIMLEENSITMDVTGIKVSGRWGSKMPMGALGDGYQATIAWILDLYGWKLLYDNKVKDIELSGIVLLDEIEHHLHPKLKKRIVKLLNEQFPNIQFIITTHSALSAVGTTELNDKQCTLVLLEQKESYVDATIATPPRGKRVDQVLTSHMFDLFSASDDSIKRDIEKYNYLFSKDRTEEEDKKMTEIIKRLSEQLGSAETDLEQLVENAIRKTLKKLARKQLTEDKEQSPEPMDFEIKRQLKQLLK